MKHAHLALTLLGTTSLIVGCQSGNQTSPDTAATAKESNDAASMEVAVVDDTPPPTDVDDDGIANDNDECPMTSERTNTKEDLDGCPDLLKWQGIGVIDEEILFAYDSEKLRPEGKEKLEEVVEQLEDSERWQMLRVAGHADERGPEAYNEDLSRRRADAVRSYLTEQGVPNDKIDLKAYGEEKPAVEDPDGPEEYAQNRRVEFEILR